MNFSRIQILLTTALSLLLCSTAARSAVVTTSTFSNATELALSGPYVHALNFGETTARTVSGVTFTNAATATGVTLTGGVNYNGTAPVFGATTDDDALELMMNSLRWDNNQPATPPKLFTVSLSGLNAGGLYRLNLLMWDSASIPNNGRTFDVAVNGTQIINHDLDLYDYAAGNANPNPDKGVVVSYVLNAPVSGNLDITYTRVGNSGVLSALTLAEAQVPEPSTLVLLLGGGVLCFASRWRRSLTSGSGGS